MKEFIKKVEKNKILFGAFILFIFLLFIFITNGFNGAIIKNWYGITYYLYYIGATTYYGSQIYSEIVWAICLIPIILVFKNKYIFTEEKLPFKERMRIIWPLLLLIVSIFILGFGYSGAFVKFNFEEFIAILVLCTFVGIFEEILCRGWLQNELIERFGNDRKGVMFSIIFSGLIFGSIHIINFFNGQELFGTIIQIISAVFFGIYLGSIYYKTKNIWTCVFLHGFWDFALFMSDLNKVNSCADMSTGSSVTVFTIFLMLIVDLPGILTAMKILEKVSIGKLINKEAKFTEEEENRSRIFNKRVSLIQVIYVSVLSVIIVFGGLMMSGVEEADDACMNYDTIEVQNISFTSLNYSNYDMRVMVNDEFNDEVSFLEYNISMKKDKLIIKDMSTNESVEVDVPNIGYFAVFNVDDKYIIEALGRPNEENVVYYSDFTNSNTVIDSNFLDNLKKSFKTLELPIIQEIGYDSSGNPMYKTPYNTFYVYDFKEFKQVIIK